MKKTFLQAALVGILSLSLGTANAEVVSQTDKGKLELFGVIDVGFLNVSGVTPRTAVATKTQPLETSTANMLLNSPMLTSYVGVRGTQPLGDGLTAGFVFRHLVLPGDGSTGLSSANGAANAPFTLASNFYLDHPKYGRMTVGRQNTPFYEGTMIMDARGGLNFGSTLSFWSDNSMFGGTATSKSGLVSYTGGNQASNLFRYDSPKLLGSSVSLGYAPGGIAGDVMAGSRKYFMLTNESIKGLTLRLSYLTSQSTAGVDNNESYSVGAKYVTGPATVAVGYAKLKNPDAANNAANSEYSFRDITGKYDITDRWAVSGGWYRLEDEANKQNTATQWSLVGDYKFSNNVGAYLGWARVNNEGNMGVVGAGTGQLSLNSVSTVYGSIARLPGQTSDAVVLGMFMKF